MELGVRGRERGSQLERSNANHENPLQRTVDRSTTTTDRATIATKTADRNRHDPAEHTLVCPTPHLFFSLEVGGVSFLATRLLIGRGVVGRLVVSFPIGWGARVVRNLRRWRLRPRLQPKTRG